MAAESVDWLLRTRERPERRCETSQMQWFRPWPRSVCCGEERGSATTDQDQVLCSCDALPHNTRAFSKSENEAGLTWRHWMRSVSYQGYPSLTVIPRLSDPVTDICLVYGCVRRDPCEG